LDWLEIITNTNIDRVDQSQVLVTGLWRNGIVVTVAFGMIRTCRTDRQKQRTVIPQLLSLTVIGMFDDTTINYIKTLMPQCRRDYNYTHWR